MEVKMAPPAPEAFAEEVNSLHSWKLKASIQGYRPARSALLPASNAGVSAPLVARLGARASKNFLFNFMDALAPWRAVKRGASYNFET